jgi:tetratricopeptide (TPR) repeat protein
VLHGLRGVGKTAFVDSVLTGLSGEQTNWPHQRIHKHDVDPIVPLDLPAFVDLVAGGPDSATPSRQGGSPLVRLEAELRRLGEKRVVVAIDSAENLLGATGKLGRDLDEACEMLATDREHRVTVLLISRQRPHSPNGGTWPAKPLLLKGIPNKFCLDYLKRLNRDGRMDPASLHEKQREDLWAKLGENPRLAELAHAVLTADKTRHDFGSLTNLLLEQDTDTVPTFLTDLLIGSPGSTQQQVVEALAVFTLPVPQSAVAALVEDKGLVGPALTALVINQVVFRAGDRYFLPPDDRKLVLDRMTDNTRQSNLYFAAASQLTDLRNDHPRRIDDLRVHFAELDALLKAGAAPSAYNMIEFIRRILREWNCTYHLFEHRVAVRGQLDDSHLEMANENAIAEIHATRGEFEEASDVFGKALEIARTRRDDAATMRIHANLAKMYWARNDIHRALGYYELALDKAELLADLRVRMGALEGIADCRRRRGEYNEAIRLAQDALAVPELDEDERTPQEQAFATTRSVAVALKLARWHGELKEPDHARRYLDYAKNTIIERSADSLWASLSGRAGRHAVRRRSVRRSRPGGTSRRGQGIGVCVIRSPCCRRAPHSASSI